MGRHSDFKTWCLVIEQFVVAERGQRHRELSCVGGLAGDRQCFGGPE